MEDVALNRLAALGLVLPDPAKPMGAYKAVVEAGTILHVSMQGPLANGRPTHRGLIGHELTLADGVSAARQAALNALAQIHAHLGGFDRVRQVIRLEGSVACAEDFLDHPAVLDGASDLLAAVFQDRAGHVRLVSGVRNLPGNLPVAVALMIELRAAVG